MSDRNLSSSFRCARIHVTAMRTFFDNGCHSISGDFLDDFAKAIDESLLSPVNLFAPFRAKFAKRILVGTGNSIGPLSIMKRWRNCLPKPRLNCVNNPRNTAHFVDMGRSQIRPLGGIASTLHPLSRDNSCGPLGLQWNYWRNDRCRRFGCYRA